jgi:ubiquinone/menaquinone biosynthesis C-methylase UbiE
MQEFWTYTLQKYILAPISNPRQILDIGCGTGSWAIEVADTFPSSQVYGIDISPVQPLYVPENCTFFLENVLNGLSFHDHQFDLVQSRCIGAGIRDGRWVEFMEEVWRVVRPGGWVQFIEIDPVRECDDGSMPSDSPVGMFERIVERVMKEKYRTTMHGVGHKLARHVAEAGFININCLKIKSPLGKWKGREFVSGSDGR